MKYCASVHMTVQLEVTVEADNPEDARDLIKRNMSPDFDEVAGIEPNEWDHDFKYIEVTDGPD